MYTKPSIVELLQAVIVTLKNDIAPQLQSSQATSNLVMAEVLLQCVIQRIQAERPILVSEHNQMTALYRALAAKLAQHPAEAAERIRQRARALGEMPDFPAPIPDAVLAEAHHLTSEGLIDTLGDLDELLQVPSDQTAQEALALVRQHLAVRAARDFRILMVNPGSLVGRG